MASDDASMAGSWYSIVSHATVSAEFAQDGNAVSGSISWALYGIGDCVYQVAGSVDGASFALTGATQTPEWQICPQGAKFSGTIGDQVIDVDDSPWGSFALRPDEADEEETEGEAETEEE
jgi:hypothetical protein